MGWLVMVGLVLPGVRAGEPGPGRPNILWLTCEDLSPTLGCYGDRLAISPTLDRLAGRGIRYDRAVGISGVCAVNRSCLITGMYSSSLGSHDMRSVTRLPAGVHCFTAYLRRAGYFCTNNAKTDYNFAVPDDAWDECSGKAHWKHRRPGQPFFAVFNYVDSHESRIWPKAHRRIAARLQPHQRCDPARVPLPPFHPDTPEVRRDWANYYENIVGLDQWVAGHLAELEEAGLADRTIVFFFSDHGAGMPGVKKWIWNGGLRVPLLVYFPPAWRHLAPGRPGSSTDRLVSFVDFAPTVLSLCGVKIPRFMQGVAFLGEQAGPPRRYAYQIRDRMAERYDMVRGVRDSHYQYYRNFMPHLPYSQYISYTEQMPTMQVWRALHEQGRLNAIQDRYFQPKPTEELYDLAADPHMVHNLAGQAKYRPVLEQMRRQLKQWQADSGDLGLLPEYLMHAWSADLTPRQLATESTRFDIRRVQAMAWLASEQDPANVAALAEALGDKDPAVRWWAVNGLLALGRSAGPAAAALEQALQDDCPIIPVAAAEALVQLGREETALPVLAGALAHESPFVRLRAMNALDRLGDKARPYLAQIKAAAIRPRLPCQTQAASYLKRMVGYVPRKFESAGGSTGRPQR